MRLTEPDPVLAASLLELRKDPRLSFDRVCLQSSLFAIQYARRPAKGSWLEARIAGVGFRKA